MLVIPFMELEKDTLQAVVEEIVTRDGTDYGHVEQSMEGKVKQVVAQLQAGKVCLCYDPETQTCSLLPADIAAGLGG